jgi:hypothetical protein
MAIVLDGTTGVTFPAGGLGNTAGDAVGTTDTQTLTNKTIQGGALTRATAATASGTSVDFTGIPSWVKRITVVVQGLSTNGASPPEIRIGDSGGFAASSYLGTSHIIGTGVSGSNMVSGFIMGANSTNWTSGNIAHGAFVLENISGNAWVCAGSMAISNAVATFFSNGSRALSGTLDRIRITTANGTDAFDAGTINIMYEG